MFDSSNSGTSLSLAFTPGEDLRFFTTANRSIFSFGDYRMQRNSLGSQINPEISQIRFDAFETISSINGQNFIESKNSVFSVTPRELNLNTKNANSYAYFASLKVEIAIALEEIVRNFPYAILLSSTTSGDTIYDYSELQYASSTTITTTFKSPYSAVTNQGNIILNSGSTITNGSLLDDFSEYSIQLSGSSLSEHPIYDISTYSFSAGSYLQFSFSGSLLSGTTATTSSVSYYIRPNKKKLDKFYKNLSPLAYKIIIGEYFLQPNPYYKNGLDFKQTFVWPKTIDGFNPDTYGEEYQLFQESILKYGRYMDDRKTNIMENTMIPENYLELDSENKIYKNSIQSFAHQFDIIKNYIDNISYAHTITYDGISSLPEKFIFKLSRLLGFKLANSFDEQDFFEFLYEDNENTKNSKKYYNLDIWRKTLVNIVWLLKRKGTRESIDFVFNLIGAPEQLIRFDEYIYEIDQNYDGDGDDESVKIDYDGFIKYEESLYRFQEGGHGRGDGRKYIDQWEPEFSPLLKNDNVKTKVSTTSFSGTRNIVNTKELEVGLDPAQAIEYDVFNWYQLSGTCWVWGSEEPFMFENLNVPFEYVVEDCELVTPDFISGMTVTQYTEFIYHSNVNPRNRKTYSNDQTSWHYPELRKIYLQYYYLIDPVSNKLNFKKIEAFLRIIELNFFNYVEQLIPATAILLSYGTIYRNTVFNRQRFIYKEGINAGSEFTNELETRPSPDINAVILTNAVDNNISCDLDSTLLISNVDITISPTINGVEVINFVDDIIDANINAVETEFIFNIYGEEDLFVERETIIGR